MSNETEHPIGEAEHPVYRTSASRTGKMMIIMLGICLVGGIIFFAMWDYWISSPAPVVAMMAGEVDHAAPAVQTGDTITQDLSFIESSDFVTLAFNALPGESDNNPAIHMSVGDKVVFNVNNGGISFHAFGVTQGTEGITGIIPGSEIGSMSNALKPGDSGTSEFIAGEEGIYYYICTVPGHREQGMVGQIIVGDVSVEEVAAPEPVVEEVAAPEPVVEEVAAPASTPVELDGVISLPEGSGVPGCEKTDECFIPFNVSVSAGDEVTWSNDDNAAHTVTSGIPGGSDGIFDSGMLMSGNTFSVILDESGEYPYYCMVHPWMTGNISVN